MIEMFETTLFKSIFIGETTEPKELKFQRAFQYLKLNFLNRLHQIESRTFPPIEMKDENSIDIFLGGSCNPTKWRHEQAIPYLKTQLISYYNPQVECWTPDLIETEFQAKESATLLLFVIDYETRSLAAMTEISYLAARGRVIVIVINSMPAHFHQTHFIQQKNTLNNQDDRNDYNNVLETQKVIRHLMSSIDVPLFRDLRLALEYVRLFFAKKNSIMTKKSSNNRQRKESFHRNIFSNAQISCSTNETDDDGYGSLKSSHQMSSRTSSIASDFDEVSNEIHDENKQNESLSIFNPLLGCLNRLFSIDGTEFVDTIKTIPTKFHPLSINVNQENLVHKQVLSRLSMQLFDIYVALGDLDRPWFEKVAIPILNQFNFSYVQRQTYLEDDPLDDQSEINLRWKSRIIYYLINGVDRLSDLTVELAFLIGQRQHHIVVYLETTIDEQLTEIRSTNERQDIERSRKYLRDLAQREKIALFCSRESSWKHVLKCLRD